ncbi:MAG: exosortase K [Gammaproteobacteria bacterium]|nr:exosortase K [Gammaproteobacteria bacterium]
MAGTETAARPGCAFGWHAWSLVLLLALVLKAGYSVAATEQLQWLLWPLAGLLNATSLFNFVPVTGGEWLDVGHSLLIVKACAGGNFLIAAWLGWLWRWRMRPFGPMLALGTFAAAWLITLLANAARIVLIGYGQDDLARLTGLSDADSHRLIGIGVYFGALLLQLQGTGTTLAAPAIYLGVTLQVPLLSAWLAGRNGIDMTHALWSAGVPLAVLLLSRVPRVPQFEVKNRCLFE